MYKNLCEKLSFSLTVIKNKTLLKLFAEFKEIDRYDHFDKSTLKEKLKHTKGNIQKVGILVSKFDNEFKPKRESYLKQMGFLTNSKYWEKLSQENTTLSEEKRLRFENLRNYFLSLQNFTLYRLPLGLILHKLKFLKKLQRELECLPIAEEDALVVDNLHHTNGIIKELIHIHISTLLHKITLLSRNIDYVDDPLPYAIAELEHCHISNHNLIYGSWAPTKKINAHIVEQTLHAINAEGHADHIEQLKKITVIKPQDNTAPLFNLVTKRHNATRYITCCPQNLASYIEFDPPRYPRLMRGRQHRYDFFKTTWEPLQKINSLSEDIQLLLTNKVIVPDVKIADKFLQMKLSLSQHESSFLATKLPNTWLTRLFCRETLQFQEQWENTLEHVNHKVVDIQLNIAERLINDIATVTRNYLEHDKPFRLDEINVVKTQLMVLLEDIRSSQLQPEKYNLITAKARLILALPFNDIIKPGTTESTTEENVTTKLVRLIKGNKIVAAKNVCDFLAYNNHILSLGDIEKIQTALIEQMDIDMEKHLYSSQDTHQFIASFHILTNIKNANSHTNSKLHDLFNRKIDVHLAKNAIIKSTTQAVLEFIKNKTWKWPLDDENTKLIMQCQNRQVLDQLTLQASKESFPLLPAIHKLIKEYKEMGEVEVVPALTALGHFFELNFSAYQSQLPKVKNIVLSPNNVVIPVNVVMPARA